MKSKSPKPYGHKTVSSIPSGHAKITHGEPSSDTTCPRCGGARTIVIGVDPPRHTDCPTCHGTGHIETSKPEPSSATSDHGQPDKGLTDRQLIHKWLGGQSASIIDRIDDMELLLDILKICERRRPND